jgi:hypothetical protein
LLLDGLTAMSIGLSPTETLLTSLADRPSITDIESEPALATYILLLEGLTAIPIGFVSTGIESIVFGLMISLLLTKACAESENKNVDPSMILIFRTIGIAKLCILLQIVYIIFK